jgi:hypothetical protein
MADNAPFSVNRPPFPNVVNTLQQGRVEQHVLTIAVAAGVPTVNQLLSTGGCTVTDTAAGRIGFTFPLGGTGAIGWIENAIVSVSTPVATMLSVDSDVVNFATGVGELEVWDAAGAALDITGSITLLIHVIKAT